MELREDSREHLCNQEKSLLIIFLCVWSAIAWAIWVHVCLYKFQLLDMHIILCTHPKHLHYGIFINTLYIYVCVQVVLDIMLQTNTHAYFLVHCIYLAKRIV